MVRTVAPTGWASNAVRQRVAPGSRLALIVASPRRSSLPTFVPSTTIAPSAPSSCEPDARTHRVTRSRDVPFRRLTASAPGGSAYRIDPAEPLAAIIGEAGEDLATAKVLHVELSKGTDRMAFDVLRVPGHRSIPSSLRPRPAPPSGSKRRNAPVGPCQAGRSSGTRHRRTTRVRRGA